MKPNVGQETVRVPPFQKVQRFRGVSEAGSTPKLRKNPHNRHVARSPYRKCRVQAYISHQPTIALQGGASFQLSLGERRSVAPTSHADPPSNLEPTSRGHMLSEDHAAFCRCSHQTYRESCGCLWFEPPHRQAKVSCSEPVKPHII